MGVNSLPKTVTRQRRDCDLNPDPFSVVVAGDGLFCSVILIFISLNVIPSADYLNRQRKCADTIGTVLVPWAGHFQC